MENKELLSDFESFKVSILKEKACEMAKSSSNTKKYTKSLLLYFFEQYEMFLADNKKILKTLLDKFKKNTSEADLTELEIAFFRQLMFLNSGAKLIKVENAKININYDLFNEYVPLELEMNVDEYQKSIKDIQSEYHLKNYESTERLLQSIITFYKKEDARIEFYELMLKDSETSSDIFLNSMEADTFGTQNFG